MSIVSHKHKFIFTHIPKTGGVSVVKILGLEEDNHKTLTELKSFPENKSFNEYFHFLFARNPFDRLVSSYKYFKKYGKDGSGDIKMGDIVNRYDTFQNFVKNLKNINDDEWVYRHFNQQVYWVVDKLDYIGRFENLQEDFNIACDKIGIPRQKLPHKNATKHKYYTEYYDDETRSIVAEKYAKDIEYFGYEFGR
jgi:hypothetical protein